MNKLKAKQTAAREISVDAATVVLSEPGGVFTLKEEHQKALEAFLGGQRVSVLLLVSVMINIAASFRDTQLMSPKFQ